MQSSMLKAIVEDFGNGGTIDGDLVVSGDLTVSGGGSLSFDEIIEGTQVIDVTSTEALLVRKNGDGGDVFVVDTTNSRVGINKTSPEEALHLSGNVRLFEAGNTADKTYSSTGAGLFLSSYQSDSGSPYTKTSDIVAGSDGTVPSEIRFFTRTSGNANLTNALTIDSSQQVGIGNSSPDKTLVVQASGAEVVIADTGSIPTLRFREGGATKGVVRTSSGSMQLYSGGTNLALTIDTNQNASFNEDVIVGADTGSGEFAKLAFKANTSASGRYANITKEYDSPFTFQIEASSSATTAPIVFKNSNAQTALTLSASADATFNGSIKILDTSAPSIRLNPDASDATDNDRAFIGYATGNDNFITGTVDNDLAIRSASTGNIVFGRGTTESMRINSSGNATFSGDINIKSTGGNDDPATLALWSPDVSISADDTIGTILAQGSDSGGSPPYLGAKIEFNADANWDTGTSGYYPTRIDFFTESNSGTVSTANPALTIDSSQRIGIGVSPSYPLHVENSGDTVGYFKSTDNNGQIAVVDDDTTAYFGANGSRAFMGTASGLAGTTNLVVDSNGNVGIGTTSPSDYNSLAHNLVVFENSNSGITIGSSTTGTGSLYFADGTSGDNAYKGSVEYSHSSNALSLRANSVVRFVLDNNSRISLSNNDSGTSNTIFGKNTALNIDAGSNYNVFIGENVADATTVDASLNVGIGFQALSALTTGDSNVATGYQSMLSNTSGTANVAYGRATLGTNVDGLGNTAIGHQALETFEPSSADTGHNTAIGMNALQAQTTGIDNTVVGALSGDAVTSQSNLTLVGKNAGGAINDNGANGTVAVGASALESLTSGSGNLAVGYLSGKNVSTGADNVGVGEKTIGGNSSTAMTGDGNTALGWLAGTNLEGSANENTLLGKKAGFSMTTGSDNVAVGMNAGDSITTGTNNICIGRGSDISAVGGTNQIAIGQGVTGQGNNSVTLGNASVTAVYMAQDSGALVHCAGIQFPASQVANGGANVLDDYEEGSGSPTVSLTGSGSVTLGTSAGNAWTKVGNIVHFQFEFSITGVSSPVGALTVQLPFTSAGTYYSAGSLRVHSETFDGSPFVAINPNATVAQLKCSKSGSSTTDITPTAGTRYFFGQITYRAA